MSVYSTVKKSTNLPYLYNFSKKAFAFFFKDRSNLLFNVENLRLTVTIFLGLFSLLMPTLSFLIRKKTLIRFFIQYTERSTTFN